MGVIKFGATQIGDVANLGSIDYSGGTVVYRVIADKQTDGATEFLNYYKSLLNTIGADDVQVVSIPRAKGVRIYQDAVKAKLDVWGTDYGDVVPTGARVRDFFASGYGTFEIDFVGSQ